MSRTPPGPARSPTAKVCTGCGAEKPLAGYRRRSDRPDGHRARCRDCEAEADARNREANRERRRETDRNYYRQNRDRLIAAGTERKRQWLNRSRNRNAADAAGSEVNQ